MLPPLPPIQCWSMADLEWMRAGEINVGFCSRGLCTTDNIEKGGVGGIACLRRAIAFMLLASAQQVALGPTFISPTPGNNYTFTSHASLNWQIGTTLACMVVAAELSWISGCYTSRSHACRGHDVAIFEMDRCSQQINPCALEVWFWRA